jgi:hypothetical protein
MYKLADAKVDILSAKAHASSRINAYTLAQIYNSSWRVVLLRHGCYRLVNIAVIQLLDSVSPSVATELSSGDHAKLLLLMLLFGHHLLLMSFTRVALSLAASTRLNVTSACQP